MADSKVSALTQLTAAAGEDLIYIVDDPAGTPISKYINVGDLLSRQKSDEADGASAIGFEFDTENTMSTSGAKLASFKTGGVEKASINKDGHLVISTSSWTGAVLTAVGTLILGGNGGGTTILAHSSDANWNRIVVTRSTTDTSNDTLDVTVGLANYYKNITGAGAGGDVAPKPMTIAASAAYASASTNLDGGDLSLVGGAGASGSAGDADGGHVKIDGGQAYGTGTDGAIYIANTRGQLSFFAATPVSQQSGTGETTGFTAGTGTSVNDDSTFTGNVGSTAYRISDVVKALKNYGLLAS